MTLDDVIRQIQASQHALERVAASGTDWSDEQRQRFDAQRLAPLSDAASRLIDALERANESFLAADRQMHTQ